MEQITDWLECWNRATVTWRRIDDLDLEAELLVPARLLAPSLEGGTEYASWLESQSRRIRGLRVPFVATHNDLTMWNVLVDSGPALGVVDWEMSREAGLPLVDFYYAAVDVAMCTKRIRARSEGYAACVDEEGWLRPRSNGWNNGYRQQSPYPRSGDCSAFMHVGFITPSTSTRQGRHAINADTSG